MYILCTDSGAHSLYANKNNTNNKQEQYDYDLEFCHLLKAEARKMTKWFLVNRNASLNILQIKIYSNIQ